MKYVKINSDRGYAPGLYQVVSETTYEYRLKLAGAREAVFPLYKAHTYEDAASRKATQDHAKQIGRK